MHCWQRRSFSRLPLYLINCLLCKSFFSFLRSHLLIADLNSWANGVLFRKSFLHPYHVRYSMFSSRFFFSSQFKEINVGGFPLHFPKAGFLLHTVVLCLSYAHPGPEMVPSSSFLTPTALNWSRELRDWTKWLEIQQSHGKPWDLQPLKSASSQQLGLEAWFLLEKWLLPSPESFHEADNSWLLSELINWPSVSHPKNTATKRTIGSKKKRLFWLQTSQSQSCS